MSTIPENFIFRFGFSIQPLDKFPQKPDGEMLDESFRIPLISHYELRHDFSRSSGNDSRFTATETALNKNVNYDFRIGWHRKGLAIVSTLTGKLQSPVCDPNRLETSDGLHLCLDMRDVRDVHRATRFCHRFFFMPCTTGSKLIVPVSYWLPIHRAKAHPNPVDVIRFQSSSRIENGQCQLALLIPGETLTGYEPLEHSRLGLYFAYSDSELGLFSLQHSPLFPVEEDPCLWSVVDLLPDSQK